MRGYVNIMIFAKPNNLFLAVILSVVSACSTVSVEEWRFPTDRITEEQWQLYLDETLSIPDVRAAEMEEQMVVLAPDGLTTYVFTTPAHPAHPGAVKRWISERDGAFYVNRQGHYAGDENAFHNWWLEFDELDRQMKEAIERETQPF